MQIARLGLQKIQTARICARRRIIGYRRMKTLDEVITQLRRLEPELRQRYPIRELGIFGSYVRGQQTEDSDVDVLVDLNDDIGLLGLAGLQCDLSEALGLKVDLVMRDAVKRGLATRILSEAVML